VEELKKRNKPRRLKKRTSYVYKIENDINHKLYIGMHSWDGVGVDPDYFGSAQGRHWKCAIKKYGKSHFHLSVIEYCSQEELPDKEKYYIKLYDTTNPEKGYNISLGGNGGDLISNMKYQDPEKYLEFKNLLSEKCSGVGNPFYGRKHSRDTKSKITESRLGDKNWTKGSKWINDGVRNKRILLSELDQYLIDNPEYQLGRIKFSAESRARMSRSHKGIVPSNKGKKFSQKKYRILKPNGKIIIRSYPNKIIKSHPEYINLGIKED